MKTFTSVVPRTLPSAGLPLSLRRPIAAFILMAGLLAGCSGGGSGSAMVMDSPPMVDGIQATISQIAGSADSILTSDVLANVPVGGQMMPFRFDTSCATDSCAAHYNGEEHVRVSVSDFDALDPNIAWQRTAVQQGVPIAEGRGELTEPGISADVTLLGGWLEHNYFAFQLEEVTHDTSDGVDVAGLEAGYAYSIGNATGTNPALSGNATWTGGMVGGSVSDRSLVRGDATLTLDMAQMAMDVAFTNIHDMVTEQSRADMMWNGLTLTNGSFGTGSQGDSIQGQFYGPNHEEVGGIFERDQIIGAFGAGR